MIPFNITIISTLLIIIVALPIIVLDIKSDLDIKNIHQYYLKEEKIPEYKDNTKILNVCLIISILVLIIQAIITIPNITKTENLSEIENTLVITTNKGNNIETQYEMFDGFKIKIPSEFKIMSDEFVNVKYSNKNAPSLIFNSFVSIFNINKAHLHNKKTNYFQLAFITLRSKFSEFPINLERLSQISTTFSQLHELIYNYQSLII